jgi:hypothetical protein
MHRDQSPLSATPLDTTTCRIQEIIDIRCDINTLLVTVKDTDSGQETIVEFVEVEGFRVLDEGDLLEFWPACSNSWLYKITAGGWLEQECLRPGFVARETKNVLEFFIAGVNACVSVIS